MNVARIGEFAWSNMEPKEGKYDFSFMLHVVSELTRRELQQLWARYLHASCVAYSKASRGYDCKLPWCKGDAWCKKACMSE